MKTKYFLFLYLVFTMSLQAGEYLFINTYPIRAKIIIDGVDTKIITPCLLKNDQLIKKVINISKSGYKPYKLNNKDIESKNVTITLIPTSFDVYFPEKNTYKIGSTQMKGPVFVSELKPGSYEIDLLNDKMTFTKTNNFFPYEASLGTAIALSFASMISTIVLSEYCANQAYLAKGINQADYDFYVRSTANVDIAKFASIATTAALGVAFSSIVAVDIATRVNNRKKEYTLLNKSPSNQDDTLFLTAMQFTASGEIERSTQIMRTIISLYPDSEHLPLIHYQIGQNYYITGDLEKARNYWETFIQDYPVSSYYDYVLKNLADIYFIEGNFERARFMLDKAVYTDNMLTKESIISLKSRIDYERYLKNTSDENMGLAETGYKSLIETFPNSEKLDTYYFMLITLYKSKNLADKLITLKEEVNNLNIDKNLKDLTLSYF